jgi:hypothetical protein
MLLLRLAYLAAALLLLLGVQRWLRGRWLTAAWVVQRSIAAVGLILAAWLVAVELWVFRAACPPCLIASLALLAGFLLGWRHPEWRSLTAVAVLLAAGLGYLFPFGTIPKVLALTEPAPGLDGLSASRLRGSGGVLVQEFSDFQCPACAQMDRTLERLVERNEGRVRLVYRHLPLTSIHPWAEPAALASECAAWQGRFWETKELLFKRQGELGFLLGDLEGRLWDLPDPSAFRACVEGREAEAAVEEDVAAARRLGLRATPSVLIGQMLVIGSAPISRLEAVLGLAHGTASVTAADFDPSGPGGSACGEGVSPGACGESTPDPGRTGEF